MGIAQLVEHLVVVQGVAGSSPVTHPKNEKRPDGEIRGAFSIETTGQHAR